RELRRRPPRGAGGVAASIAARLCRPAGRLDHGAVDRTAAGIGLRNRPAASRGPRVMRRILFVLALLLAAPRFLFASGEERTSAGDDLMIQTDTRWAGGAQG